MILLMLALLLPLQPSPDSLFAEGNARFDRGDYAGARDAYLHVLRAGQASTALYANLGNTYFRLDSLPRAVQYFEKGRALEPESPRLAHNLRITRARLALTDRPAPEPYWQSGWAWMHRHVSDRSVFFAGLVCFLGAVALSARRAWSGEGTPWLRRGLLVLAPAALALLALSFALSADAGVVRRAVVLAPTAFAERAEAAEALRAGQVVRILRTERDRVEVVAADGQQGWVAPSMLGEI